MKAEQLIRTSGALEVVFDDGTLIAFGSSKKYGDLLYISLFLSEGMFVHHLNFQFNDNEDEIDAWHEAMELSKITAQPTGDLAKTRRL